MGAAPRSLATRYVEEGIRHDDHPLVHFVDGETGRRAALLGTQLDVWEVIAAVRDNENDLQAAAVAAQRQHVLDRPDRERDTERMKRARGIEPPFLAWEASVLAIGQRPRAGRAYRSR